MKRKEREELKNFNKEELFSKLRDMERNLFDIKLKHSMRMLKNPLQIRELRRDIARVKTLIRSKFGIKV